MNVSDRLADRSGDPPPPKKKKKFYHISHIRNTILDLGTLLRILSSGYHKC